MGQAPSSQDGTSSGIPAITKIGLQSGTYMDQQTRQWETERRDALIGAECGCGGDNDEEKKRQVEAKINAPVGYMERDVEAFTRSLLEQKEIKE